jgi:RHS repeat-associated protein
MLHENTARANPPHRPRNLDEYVWQRIDFRVGCLIRHFRLTADDADDLRQSMALEVCKALRRFDPSRSARYTYVNRTLDRYYRHVARQLRSQRRHAPWCPSSLSTKRDLADAHRYSGNGQIDDFELIDLQHDVAVIVASLPPRLRRIASALMSMNRVAQIDAEGRATIMRYDALGRLIERILPLGQSETYAYDVAGNMTSRKDYNGKTTIYTYDINNRRRTETAPESKFLTTLNGTGGETLTGQFTYVSFDQSLRIEITHDFTDIDYIHIERTDESGVVFDVSAAAGGSSASGIDVTWSSPPIAELFTDKFRLKIALIGGTKIHEVIQAVEPATLLYDYLASGLRTQAGGDTYGYDAQGRLSWETKENGDRLDYGYDDAGNRTSVAVTPNGAPSASSTTTYAYDHLNRLTSVTDDGGATFTTYAYDANGNRRAVTYPNGTTAFYLYDKQNRLTNLTNYRNGFGSDTISLFVYDVGPAGNRRGVEETLEAVGDPSAQAELQRDITYEYDDLYRLTREYVLEDGEEKLDVTYVYNNKVGNRDVMIREDGDCRYITTYSYDENDRLTGSSTSIEAATLEMQRKLDRKYAGRPRGWTRWAVLGFAGATLSAFWMPLFLPSSRRLGRRARRKQLFTACVATFLAPLMAVHPEAAHALTTEAIQAQVAITAGVALDCDDTITTTYAYDANGNQIGRTRTDSSGTHTDTYVFDYKNRLVQAATRIEGPPAFVRYTYDADGIRNRKALDANTGTFFLTDKNRPYAQVIEERTDDVAHDLIVAYTYGDDLISQTRPDGSAGFDARYYHYDGQMSTRQLTDDNASPTSVAVTHRYKYDAFGVGLETSRAVGEPTIAYRYTGEQYDGTLGHYYLRARYYGQTIGRFASSDPFVGFAQDPISLHNYVYAHVDPVRHIDPSGYFSFVGTLASITIGGLVNATLGASLRYAQGDTKNFWREFGQDFAIGAIFAPVGGVFARIFGPLIRLTMRPILRIIGRLQPIVAQGVNQTGVRRLLVNISRLFLNTNKTYPPVDSTLLGRAFKRLFGRWLDFEQHHIFIQQAWSRIGSPNQVYNDLLANEGLRRIGNGLLNLLPIPRAMNQFLGRSPLATNLFATAYYSILVFGPIQVLTNFNDD